MRPDELLARMHSLEVAADFVEAIDDRDLQRRNGWDLSGWSYQLVPWGVRFVYRGWHGEKAEVLVLADLSPGRPRAAALKSGAGLRVVLTDN